MLAFGDNSLTEIHPIVWKPRCSNLAVKSPSSKTLTVFSQQVPPQLRPIARGHCFSTARGCHQSHHLDSQYGFKRGGGLFLGKYSKSRIFGIVWIARITSNYYIYIYKLQSTELTGMSHSCPSPACDCVILSLLTTSLHLICPPNSLK